MSIEPYALANSRPPALPAVRAEPNLLQRLHPLSAPRHAELYFGQVEPVLQYRPDVFSALRIPARSWNTPVSTVKEDSTPHDLHPALKRPWPRIVSDNLYKEFFGTTTTLDTFHAVATYAPVANRTAISPLPTQLPLVHLSSPKSATSDAQPFLLIERVKNLLDQQKIREARRTLEIGSSRYPASRQIARLLRAISPGRVSPTGWASSGRERETAWIKQHGHEYRGKWIALDGDRLIAFAANLSELIANLDTRNEREKPPFIQHLMSE